MRLVDLLVCVSILQPSAAYRLFILPNDINQQENEKCENNLGDKSKCAASVAYTSKLVFFKRQHIAACIKPDVSNYDIIATRDRYCCPP